MCTAVLEAPRAVLVGLLVRVVDAKEADLAVAERSDGVVVRIWESAGRRLLAHLSFHVSLC